MQGQSSNFDNREIKNLKLKKIFQCDISAGIYYIEVKERVMVLYIENLTKPLYQLASNIYILYIFKN